MSPENQNERCPSCHRKLGEWTQVPGQTPETDPGPGTVAICWMCGKILLVDDQMRLKVPSEEELRGLKERAANWPAIKSISDGIVSQRKREACLN